MSRVPNLQLVRPVVDEDAGVEVPTTLEGLFRRYSAYVAAIGLRLLGRDDEVDDLVQDVFLDAKKGLSGLRDPAAAKGWLASIAVRKARRRLKRRRRRSWVGLDHGADYEAVVDPSASPEQRATLATVYRVLDRVDPDARIAWALRYVEGRRLAQTAELCGCSLATVKRRIARAQAALLEAFDDA